MTNVFKSFCHYQKAGYRHWGPLKLTMSSDQSSFLGGMGYQMRRINGKYATSRTPAMQHGGTVGNVPFVNLASFSSNSSSSAGELCQDGPWERDLLSLQNGDVIRICLSDS